MNRYVLAVDQSTSATKAILFSDQGQLVGRSRREHGQHYPGPGRIEHDPQEIYGNTVTVITAVLKETGIQASALAALALTNQRETIVVWDRKTGLPLHNALVWQDQRGTACCETLQEKGLGPMVRAKTGLLLDTYFSASKLKWLVDEVPQVREAARQGRALCGTVDSWLIWKLTGGRVHATDYSNACRTMLFNVHELQWDQELRALFGAEDLQFPEVRFADQPVGPAQVPGLDTDLALAMTRKLQREARKYERSY